MLLKLFVLLCSTYSVFSQYEINPSIPIQFPTKIEEQNLNQDGLNYSESMITPLFKQTTLCPANEVLIQIQNILMKLLGNEDESNESLKVLAHQGNGLFNKESALNFGNEIEKVLPLSKENSLRQLLENNQLNSNYKTKITVRYEIPNEPDHNCKQALSNILQVLKNANLMHESYRSCGPYDINCQRENVLDMKNIGNRNVFTTNINQGNNNYLPNLMNNQKSIDSNLLGSDHDLNTVLKYLALKRNPAFKSIFENYGLKEQRINDIKTPIEMPETINKLTKLYADGTEFVQNKQTNYSDKSTPYQLHITENIVPPTNLNEINQELNMTEIIAENPILNTQVPLENFKNEVVSVDEKPNDVLVTVTNDGRIVSVYPSKNNLIGQGSNNLVTDTFLADYTKLQNKENVASHVKNLLNQYLQGNVNNLPQDKRNALLAVLKTTGPTSQYQQFPQVILGDENVKPFYVNPYLIPNVNQYSINPGLSNSVRQYPYSGLDDQLHENLNVFNQISNQENILNQYSAHQPYVTRNPNVNSKLVDYGKHVNELHTPYNLDNLQRFVTETNQGKLNSTPDNSGVVELTYLLKRPHPVVYQPVYYVKYRLPYDSFVNNLRDLVRRQPQLRSNRAKLYQELLALSKVAEVSPNLKGLGQQQLLQMVANNGALVKTKVLKVNDTLLDKQLKIVQDLNSNQIPIEIGNESYKDESNGLIKDGLLNKTIEIVLNETRFQELENFEKPKLSSSNFSNKDILNSYKTATNQYNVFSTDKNPNKLLYPLL